MLYQLSYCIVMILQLLIDSNVTDRQTDRLMNGGNHSVTDRLTNVTDGKNDFWWIQLCYRQTD